MTRAVSRARNRAARYQARRPDLTGRGLVCAAWDWFRAEVADADPTPAIAAVAGLAEDLENRAAGLNRRKQVTP